LAGLMKTVVTSFPSSDFTIDSFQILFLSYGLVFLQAALPLMAIIVIVSVAINYFQVGFVFTLEPLIPSLDKLNPISGFSRMFSMRSLVELAKSIFKIFIISFFIYRFAEDQANNLPKIISFDLISSLQWICSLGLDLAFRIITVLLVLSVADYYFQLWQHNKSLKMSKQEVKEEMKQAEGDPKIKSQIKQKQRAMAMQRMMQEVPSASVVVTNPTHFAVALKYEPDMPAPLVVAKGQDYLAFRIKEVAREHGVTIVENKPLARSLYSLTEIGDLVPAELYQAVAEVLAYVYRLKKKLS
ncbi:MAG: flagellar biosynthesis protein FlhB, partial [Sporomusaceae bacterium]|nr:flagellar biosynthesis protein FlhB [Sporomusaceae bacterium]